MLKNKSRLFENPLDPGKEPGEGFYRVFVAAAKGKSLPAPLKTPYEGPINTLAGIRNEKLIKNRKTPLF